MAMDNGARLTLRPFVVASLRPASFAEDVPVGVLADWHDDKGDFTVAQMLRQLDVVGA
jgi:hypothetical protein